MKTRPHIQIALVGGQPTPVYQGIVHLQPDQVVLVCSESSHQKAEDIRNQLPMYKDKDIIIYQIPESNLQMMYDKAEMIERALPKGITISLNVTGGMKLWSVIFNNVFRRKRRSCRRFFIGQNGMYFDLKNKASDVRVNFDMDAQFKMLGHTVSSYIQLSEYTPEDNSVLNVIRNWGFSDKYHYPLFILTKDFVDGYKEKFKNNNYTNPFYTSNKFGSLNWDPNTKTFDCTLCFKHLTITSPHVENIVLNTGWFELYVAQVIAHKYPSGQVWLNCVFNNKNNTTKNEVDIIVNTGNKLIFVECKTQVQNSTDVDKFHSVVKNYGGLGSKHLFVTYAPMQDTAREKCEDYGITTFYLNNPVYKNQHDIVDALSKVLDDLELKWNIK